MTLSLQTFQLLLVDDNSTNLELMCRIIERHLPEIRCLLARNAKEGYKLLQEQQVDGAFIDVQMPRITGIEMCRQLKNNPETAHIPIVLLTAHVASPQTRAEGLDAGAYDFISQPISNIELLARLRVMLRIQRERKQLADRCIPIPQELNQHPLLPQIRGLLNAAEALSLEPQELSDLLNQLGSQANLGALQFVDLILPKLPASVQRGLLQLALLDKIPLALLNQFSDLGRTPELLAYLLRRNFYIQLHERCYQLDAALLVPLRRAALGGIELQARQEFHGRVAQWYQHDGNFLEALFHLLHGEFFTEAATLLSLTGLSLSHHEPALMTQILEALPEEEAAKSGWLSLFYGSANLLLAPDQAGGWFELARSRFAASADTRGELLALAQQLRQHLLVDGLFSYGREILPRADKLFTLHQNSLDHSHQAFIMLALAAGYGFFSAETLKGENLARCGLELAQRSHSMHLEFEGRIICAYLALLRGRNSVACAETESAWHLVRTGVQPTAALYLLASDLRLQMGDLSGYKIQRQQLLEHFPWSHLQQGTHASLLNLLEVQACLQKNDLRGAEASLSLGSRQESAAHNPHLRSILLQFQALIHAHKGKDDIAQSELEESLRLRKRAGGGFYQIANLLVCGLTLYQMKKSRQALQLFYQALTLSLDQDELLVRPTLHAGLALIHAQQAETAQALEHLRTMLKLLRQPPKCCYLLLPQLLETLPLAMKNNVFPEVAKQLAIRFLNQDLSAEGQLIPCLKFQLLGGFYLQLGASQQRDISNLGAASRYLLYLLIFAPGRQMSLDVLCRRVWPDLPAVRARQNLDTLLLRLRKMLEEMHPGSGRIYFPLERGVLHLRYAQVDAVDFRMRIEEGRNFLRRGDSWQASHPLLAGEDLWRGELLQGFDLNDDMLNQQTYYNELRFEQLELLGSLDPLLTSSFDLESLFLKGLDADPIREALLRQLIELYRRRKDVINQKKILQRYSEALQQADFSPGEIEEIVRSLQAHSTGTAPFTE